MRLDSTSSKLFFSTVKLLINDSAEGGRCGTAFVFRYDARNDGPKFLVTAKHIVKNANTGYFFWTESDESGYPMMGKMISLEFERFSTYWTPHPDENVDVAVMPLEPAVESKIKEMGRRPFRVYLEQEIILSPEDSLAIERITFVGYPAGLSDTVNFTPFARSGITATPYALDYNGMPAFLIDASVYSGSCGSPVLISRGIEPNFLPGIVTDTICIDKEVKRVSMEGRQAEMKLEIDLGIVTKAHTILETVEHWLSL